LIRVGEKTFKFKKGTESELEALMKAKAHIRELQREANARIYPEAGAMADDPLKGPGRRAKRSYDNETGEIFPNDPRYAKFGSGLPDKPPPLAKAKAKKSAKRGKDHDSGNVKLTPAPAVIRVSEGRQ
jgi:hypothetical protein